MTILAVHVGPALAVYGIRWWYSDLQENFPDTFHFDVDRLQSASEYTIYILFLPMLSYVLVWAIPYFIFMFILADTYIHEKGYRTIYGHTFSLALYYPLYTYFFNLPVSFHFLLISSLSPLPPFLYSLLFFLSVFSLSVPTLLFYCKNLYMICIIVLSLLLLHSLYHR